MHKEYTTTRMRHTVSLSTQLMGKGFLLSFGCNLILDTPCDLSCMMQMGSEVNLHDSSVGKTRGIDRWLYLAQQ